MCLPLSMFPHSLLCMLPPEAILKEYKLIGKLGNESYSVTALQNKDGHKHLNICFSRWRRLGDQYHRDGCWCWCRPGETWHIRQDCHWGWSCWARWEVRTSFPFLTKKKWTQGTCFLVFVLFFFFFLKAQHLKSYFLSATHFNTYFKTCSRGHALSLSDLTAGVRIRSTGPEVLHETVCVCLCVFAHVHICAGAGLVTEILH